MRFLESTRAAAAAAACVDDSADVLFFFFLIEEGIPWLLCLQLLSESAALCFARAV